MLAGFGRDVTTGTMKWPINSMRTGSHVRQKLGARARLDNFVWNLWMYCEEQEVLEVSLQASKSQLELTRALYAVKRVRLDLLASKMPWRSARAHCHGKIMRFLQDPWHQKPFKLRFRRIVRRGARFAVCTANAAGGAFVHCLEALLVLAYSKNIETFAPGRTHGAPGSASQSYVTFTLDDGTPEVYASSWEGWKVFGVHDSGGLSFSWTVEALRPGHA
jgi:hypothetical protein